VAVPDPPARVTGGRTRPQALAERLHEIGAEAAAPEDALEPALQAIVDACGAAAGALCLFDPRQGLLRLAAEVGLSDEGCRRLRTVRWSDPSSWDMPLHGLMNRRAYLIESAVRNRYVPRLVEQGTHVRTIACVPVYGGPDPLASLVLISVAPRSFGERDIQQLMPPLRELGALIEAARRRGVTSGAETAAAPAPRGPLAELAIVTVERDHLLNEISAREAETERLGSELTERIGEVDRLRLALDEGAAARAAAEAELASARREASRVATLAASLADIERERDRLVESLAAAEASRGRLAERADELEHSSKTAAADLAAQLKRARQALTEQAAKAGRQAKDLEAELERVRGRLAEADAAVAAEREREQEHAREIARLTSELEATTTHEQRLRGELEAVDAQAAARGEADLAAAHETARTADAARARAEAEARAARSEVERLRAELAALSTSAIEARNEATRLDAVAREYTAERAQDAQALEEARAEVERLTIAIAEREEEAATLRAQLDGLRVGEREHGAERSVLSVQVERLTAECARLGDATASADAEVERLRGEAGGAAAAQARLEAALEREMSERAAATAALAQSQAALEGLRSTQARTESEASARAADFARLEAECERLAVECESLRAAAQAGESAPTAIPIEEPAEEPATVSIVTVMGGGRGGRRREGEGAERVVAVLDVEGAWDRVTSHDLVVVPPTPEAADRLKELTPERLLVNLVAPGALETIAALRAAGSTTRFWGCIADGAKGRGLPLGMIEPAAAPLDPDALVASLEAYVVKGGRVVTAGADVDALMSLRQALTRQGISVSMAWDAKQATDLLSVVRPHVAVIDLDLPRRDGYAIVAGLGAALAAPHAVIVGTGDPAAFAATLADVTHATRAVPLDRILSSVLAGSEAPPVVDRKQQKVRALPVAPR
jgi:septal ring factor EnvC (AmiA/AmiB activator)